MPRSRISVRAERLGFVMPVRAFVTLAVVSVFVLLPAWPGDIGTSRAVALTPPAVRNHEPEKAVVPVDTEWPAHYPRRSRRIVADGEAGGETGGETRPLAEGLLHRFMNLHTAMRYEEALPIARALVEATPDRPIGHYNLTCVLGRLHRADEALTSLEKAVECGWRNVTHTRIDPDLERFREDIRFRGILARMEELIDLERVPMGPLRDESPDVIARDLSEKVPALLERYHVPRLEVALIRDGACVWTRGFNAAAVHAGSDRSGRLVYPLASPGHLLTLIAAAQLDARDKLDLGQLLLNGEALARSERGSRFAAAGGQPGTGRRGVGTRGAGARGGGATGAANRPGGGNAGAGQWSSARSPAFSRAFGQVAHQLRSDRAGGDQPGGGFALWPNASESTATLKLLRLAVEISSGEDYSAYCEQQILDPLSMTDTVLTTGSANPALLSAGFSELGTRLRPRQRTGAEHALTCTTVTDLARLVGLMLGDPHSTRRVLPAPARAALADAVDFGLGRLGLGVHVEATTAGPRMQVASLTDGTGCLMRWYSESRCGVVILFNSETGSDAALRIAALALGGD